MEGIYLSSASYLLLVGLAVLLAFLAVERRARKDKKYAPGPRPWPILGSLHLLGGYDPPYKAFDVLSKKYGPVIKLRLGQVDCVVVSSLDTIKEVLINKGESFDGRPDFSRYNQIFGGRKENSLAFCDWSDLHKLRREVIREFTFPRAFSHNFYQLETIVNRELTDIMKEFGPHVTNVKPLILHACGNIFFQYFASTRFELGDLDYAKMLMNFDLVFYEVNQGYAADFMPWLNPLLMNKMIKTRKWGKEIREFIHKRVLKTGGQEGDLLHSLLECVNKGQMEMETALFAFEDMIGGYSAVANLIIKIFGYMAKNVEVQKKMQEEVDSVTCGKTINFGDRPMMPYTQAVILESIRHVCSPIVPRVANQDTTINDYHVDKGTMVFLNNYTLHMSPELWNEPEKFSPERFLTEEGSLLKPEHFVPFGGGKRSCMGFKMTQFISFATLATLMQKFTITPLTPNAKIPIGDLALPYDTLKFNLHPR